MTPRQPATAAEITYMTPDIAIAEINQRMSERAFQWRVLSLAWQCGWLAYHTFDSRRSQPGFPDLVLVRLSRVIWAELKSEKGRLTVDQQKWLDALSLAGHGDVRVWRPSDWQEIQETLT